MVLAAAPLTRMGPMMWTVVTMKLAVHPVLVWLGLGMQPGIEGLDSLVPILVAAGPCGAMPFVIATQYGVPTETIAKTILVSTTLSVLSLAILV